MCFPAILGLAAGVVQGIGAAQQASAQAASFRAQEAFQKRQAELELAEGSYQAARTQDEIDRTLGTQRAQTASSGLALSGTPARVIEESAAEGAMDVAAIRWNSGLAAENELFKAKVSGMNAADAARSAPLALAAPVISAGAKYGASFG